MRVEDFFSSSLYVFLPTVKNPKVALSVDNVVLAENSFKLYNPFSVKAKILKKISQIVFINFNTVSISVRMVKRKEKAEFLRYLEKKLNKSLVSSIYFSSIHDKVVLQLQTLDAGIVGYLKYPLNKAGLQHLENEKKAIEVLSKNKIIQRYLLHDEFNGKPFLLLGSLEGQIGLVERKHIDELLLKFNRGEVYRLVDHPRIAEIKKNVDVYDMSEYLYLIEEVCQKSTLEYALVYEHGDFTPWNIVKVNNNYIPFDFENFTEDGLEYFDVIKYYYQIGRLLKNMSARKLVAYIFEQVDIREIREILQLFLIKEVALNKEEGKACGFEINVLEEMKKK